MRSFFYFADERNSKTIAAHNGIMGIVPTQTTPTPREMRSLSDIIR